MKDLGKRQLKKQQGEMIGEEKQVFFSRSRIHYLNKVTNSSILILESEIKFIRAIVVLIYLSSVATIPI
jgi:predicted ThiF/HesA family dinucleotide-utilizing enzyme